MIRLLRLRLLQFIGKMLNLGGFPGFVCDCDYQGAATDAAIRVRRTDFYTIITVNGLDIYFNRLTGFIDGTGLCLTSDCKPVQAEQSARSDAPHAAPLAIARTREP